MKINQITETTAGSVASVAMPMGGMNKRAGSMFKGKKTKKPFYEENISEEDLIIIPGQAMRHKSGFIAKSDVRTDHEVHMAKGDLFQAMKNAKQIFDMIKNYSEEDGLEGWVQEKIIKASDYLNTVREYLENQHLDEAGVIAGGVAFENQERKIRYNDEDDWMNAGLLYTYDAADE